MIKTKIVSTLGPASSDDEIIAALINAGTTMFRLNTSHGSEDEHALLIKKIRRAARDKFIPILVDLQGPKIRVGNIQELRRIKPDDTVILEATEDISNPDILPVDYCGISNDVKTGDRILLDDGKIGLLVTKVENNQVFTKVLFGECIKPRKGVNIPGSTASLSAITPRDIEFIRFAVEYEADYLALSFVREAKDIELAKKYIKDFGGNIPVIAKIEKPQAVKNLDEILKITDGIMVARGDLGIEMSPQEVPIVQKYIVNQTIRERKVCIVATQMLESMIENPIPTRAEASDVANAILDGVDGIMLSGETAMGKYPIEAVKMMKEIAQSVEDCKFCPANLNLPMNERYELSPQAISNAAIKMAEDTNAKAILAFTHTGYTPKLLAKLKPSVPIIAISDLESTCRRLNLYWDISPDCKRWDTVLDSRLLKKIDDYILEKTCFKKGERIIIIGSIPKLITGRTNFIRVHRIGAPNER